MAATRSISDLPGPEGPAADRQRPPDTPDERCTSGRGVVRAATARSTASTSARGGSSCSATPGAINEVLRDRPDGFRRWSEIKTISRRDVGDGWGLRGRGRRLAPAPAAGRDRPQQQPPAALLRGRQHLHRDGFRRRLEPAARDGRPVRDRRALSSFTVDVTSSLAFGHDLNTLERGDSELQGHLHRVFHMTNRRLFAPLPYWRWFKLPADRALDRSLAEIETAVTVFMDEARGADRRAARAARGAGELPRGDDRRPGKRRRLQRRGDRRQRLHAAARRRGHHLAHDGLDDLVDGLAARRSRRDGPRRRARSSASGPTRPSTTTVEAFRYGEGVLRESMRLKPVAPITGVEPLADTEVAGVRVPAGTRAAAPAPPRGPAGRRAGR